MEKHTYNGNTKTTQITTDENGVVVSKQEEIVVDWLSKELMNVEPNTFGWDKLFEQAKEMYKQEIIDAWEDGHDSFSTRNAEQYYNETYGGKENE